ncbi:unnamed protein product, partial [Plutella xylostella]
DKFINTPSTTLITAKTALYNSIPVACPWAPDLQVSQCWRTYSWAVYTPRPRSLKQALAPPLPPQPLAEISL